MKIVKKPKWDKQNQPQTILADPDGLNKDAPITEPLAVGQAAWGTVGGVEIKVKLTKLLIPTDTESEIIRIRENNEGQEIFGELSIGDTVLIKREDMKSLDVDI